MAARARERDADSTSPHQAGDAAGRRNGFLDTIVPGYLFAGVFVPTTVD